MKTAIIDIDAIAEGMGLETKMVVRPVMPDAPPVQAYDWQPCHLEEGLRRARVLAYGAEQVELQKVGNRWVLPAMACAMWPLPICFSMPGMGTPPLRIPELPMGEPSEMGGIRFIVERRGACVFIDYLADDPEKPPVFGPHNYDIQRLPAVVTPQVQPEDEVFFGGNGQFPVLMAIARAYCGKCRSISVLSQTEPRYVCIWSQSRNRRVGDVTAAE